MFMRIVKFNDGTFGIRKLTIWGFGFYDFRSNFAGQYWWTYGLPGSKYLYDGSCRTTEETAKEVFCRLSKLSKPKPNVKDNGTAINYTCQD
jgi:hypothetical protein